AVSSQLLETSINGATRVLVNVTSGNDLTLAEFTEAADQIYQLCDQRDANIIFGWVPDPSLEGEVRVTVLATGFGPREGQAAPDRRPPRGPPPPPRPPRAAPPPPHAPPPPPPPPPPAATGAPRRTAADGPADAAPTAASGPAGTAQTQRRRTGHP